MAKVEKLIKRDDGSEVKLVAEAFFGRGLHLSIGVYGLRRLTPDQDWSLLSDRPHPDWRAMPVSEYVDKGRSELLQAVSPGEILQLTSTLMKSLGEQPQASPTTSDDVSLDDRAAPRPRG